jgi:predicted nucleic acid-binding protein
MHLLDTPVVVALRDARSGRADPGLTDWASGVAPQSLFISAITLHELEGIAARTMRKDRAAGALWRAWLDDQVVRAFDGRVLAIDAAIVRRAAAIDYADQRDGLIAATALEHGLTLATLRPRAFKAGRVKTFDPSRYVVDAGEGDWRQASRAAPAWIKGLFVRS